MIMLSMLNIIPSELMTAASILAISSLGTQSVSSTTSTTCMHTYMYIRVKHVPLSNIKSTQLQIPIKLLACNEYE